jgi:hypothetical protein
MECQRCRTEFEWSSTFSSSDFEHRCPICGWKYVTFDCDLAIMKQIIKESEEVKNNCECR